ncbi:MAG: hypothetical protein U0168_22015 [Nannocystaceae bacterium]
MLLTACLPRVHPLPPRALHPGWVHPQYFDAVDSLGRPDVYGSFVRSFQHPLITSAYLGASLAVAMHATHATSSLLRTLGLSAAASAARVQAAGPVVGVAP